MAKRTNKAEQKLISFVYDKEKIKEVDSQLKNGWNIVSLVRNGNLFVGIAEKTSLYSNLDKEGDHIFYIPPRKKIKILSQNIKTNPEKIEA
mgnify:CR=1 FL=1